MEYISKYFVVYFVLIHFIWLNQSFYIFIVELLFTSQIGIQKCWRKHFQILELAERMQFFLYWFISRTQCVLSCDQRKALDVMMAFYQEL